MKRPNQQFAGAHEARETEFGSIAFFENAYIQQAQEHEKEDEKYKIEQ